MLLLISTIAISLRIAFNRLLLNGKNFQSRMAVTIEQITQCFKPSPNSNLYGRETEISAINSFISSELPILHITGNPGTGKTCTVQWVLRNTEFLYLNYFFESNIGLALKRCSCKIVVIDEFDKYFEEKKNECLKGILQLKSKGKKLITISNNLRLGNVRFKPYTSIEILEILENKMNGELGEQVIDEKALKFISKKFEKTGDLRAVFKAIQDIYSNKSFSAENYKLKFEDLIEKKDKAMERSIHQEMIYKIKESEHNRRSAYKKYIKECETVGLVEVPKTDFDLIFDLH